MTSKGLSFTEHRLLYTDFALPPHTHTHTHTYTHTYTHTHTHTYTPTHTHTHIHTHTHTYTHTRTHTRTYAYTHTHTHTYTHTRTHTHTYTHTHSAWFLVVMEIYIYSVVEGRGSRSKLLGPGGPSVCFILFLVFSLVSVIFRGGRHLRPAAMLCTTLSAFFTHPVAVGSEEII